MQIGESLNDKGYDILYRFIGFQFRESRQKTAFCFFNEY